MNKVLMPSWIAVFVAAAGTQICTRLNHPAGKGCNKPAVDCSWDHKCAMCRKTDHGAFFLSASQNRYVCEMMNNVSHCFAFAAKDLGCSKKDVEDRLLKAFWAEPSKRKSEAELHVQPAPREPTPEPAPLLPSIPATVDSAATSSDDTESEDAATPVEIQLKYDPSGDEAFPMTATLSIDFFDEGLIAQTTRSRVFRGNLLSWLGKDSVAVKIWTLPSERQRKKAVQTSLRTEIRALHKMARCCSSVVSTYSFTPDVFQYGAERYMCLIMELCAITLDKFVTFEGGDDGVLSDKIQRSLVLQLLAAYDVMHEASICHRDVKPANILIKDYQQGSPDEPVLKLCDFASSKILEDSESSLMSTVVGTVETGDAPACWVAPEVGIIHPASGEVEAGIGYRKTSDLWSLGCVLHFVGTSKPLFETQEASRAVRRDTDLDDKCGLSKSNPLLWDLIIRFVQYSADARMECRQALLHPYTWTSDELKSVLSEMRSEFRSNSHLVAQLDRHTLVTSCDQSLPQDWVRELERYAASCRPSHPYHTLRGCRKPSVMILVLRNLMEHMEHLTSARDRYQHVSEKVRESVPDLLIHIFELLQHEGLQRSSKTSATVITCSLAHYRS